MYSWVNESIIIIAIKMKCYVQILRNFPFSHFVKLREEKQVQRTRSMIMDVPFSFSGNVLSPILIILHPTP